MNKSSLIDDESPLPCPPLHWASLSSENQISLDGALRQYKSSGRMVLAHRLSSDFVGGFLPLEKGQMVLLGALSPNYAPVMKKLKTLCASSAVSHVVAAIYALAPSLRNDECLRDWFMMQALRASSQHKYTAVKDAYAAGLDIWQTSSNSNLCMRCRKR